MRQIQPNSLINLFHSNTMYNITMLCIISSYITSGANQTVLVKFNSLNSQAIAPKTQVPFGFPYRGPP